MNTDTDSWSNTLWIFNNSLSSIVFYQKPKYTVCGTSVNVFGVKNPERLLITLPGIGMVRSETTVGEAATNWPGLADCMVKTSGLVIKEEATLAGTARLVNEADVGTAAEPALWKNLASNTEAGDKTLPDDTIRPSRKGADTEKGERAIPSENVGRDANTGVATEGVGGIAGVIALAVFKLEAGTPPEGPTFVAGTGVEIGILLITALNPVSSAV